MKPPVISAIGNGHEIRQGCAGNLPGVEVLGAEVYNAPEKEIGWFEVSWTEKARKHTLFDGFPRQMPALHWHGDTFTLPSGSIRLCESAACANQGFLYGDHVVGLQFHMEIKREGLQRLIDLNTAELKNTGPWIQQPKQMLNTTELFKFTHNYMSRLLIRFFGPG